MVGMTVFGRNSASQERAVAKQQSPGDVMQQNKEHALKKMNIERHVLHIILIIKYIKYLRDLNIPCN
jgi:hypothetical protein